MFLQVSSLRIKLILFPSLYSTLVLSQVAVPDLLDAVKSADILIFVIPHQFIARACDTIKGKIKQDALGMSLIKVPYTHEYMQCVRKSFLCHFLSYSAAEKKEDSCF